MRLVTLRDLYIAELQDLFDAERQLLVELPRLRAAATSAALQALLDEHLEQTRIHTERLELLLRQVGAPDRTAMCQAMRGLLAEAGRRLEIGERGDVLDAALIGVALRVEHYEIAAYGCARSYAHTLGDEQAATILQQTLDDERAAVAHLTQIAQRGINPSAGEGEASTANADRSRLQYVPAASLRDFKFRESRIRSDDGEDLGTLDGVIVDARSQRPQYFVVDSGGWFVGRRYVVPIGALRPDEASGGLRTDLTRTAIAAYPPFAPDAFQDTSKREATASCDEYQPPTWLMTGVWMTEASGFASVPPRAQCDFSTASNDKPSAPAEYPENELMIARGEPEERGQAALDGRKPE